MPECACAALELWRDWIEERAGADLPRIETSYRDQKAFAKLTRTILKDLQSGQPHVALFRSNPGLSPPSDAPHLREVSFCFDVELLAALLDSGTAIEEVPVDWRDVPGSKLHVGRDAARMWLGLLRIRHRRARWTL